MSVLISSGEASGDALAGELIYEMRKSGYEGRVFAVGGAKTEAAGAELLADSRDWAAVGIFESAKAAPRVSRHARQVRAWIEANTPKLIIAIDFGYFNIWLLKRAKPLGVKTLYFMPPGSWRRNKQGKDLPAVADLIATPFEWSAKILNDMGANAVWVGHPLLQLAAGFARAERDRIAVLPGSRTHEIYSNTPVMARAMEMAGPDLTVEAPLAPGVDPEKLQKLWRRHTSVPLTTSTEGAAATLGRARAAIICSGSATLEAAILRTPMVVIYRLNRAMVVEAFVRRPKFDFIALPNIIAQKSVVPELIHNQAFPGRIAQEIGPLIQATPEREAQLLAFSEIDAQLGPPDAITRTARMALDMLEVA